MKKLSALAVLLACLTACGHSDTENARREMEYTKANYKSCLSDYPDEPGRCDALKSAYEADLQAYHGVSNADK